MAKPSAEEKGTLAIVEERLGKEAGRLLTALRKMDLPLKFVDDGEITETDTGGCAITIAKWKDLPDIELWLDTSAGNDRHRFWVGFSSYFAKNGGLPATFERLIARLPRELMPETTLTTKNWMPRADKSWGYRPEVEDSLGQPYLEKYPDAGWRTAFMGFIDWGGHAQKDRLLLDVHKAADFIRQVVQAVPRARGGRSRDIHDAAHCALVEDAAIKRATKYFEDEGYNVESREAENLGWDLDAVKGRKILRAEVKGLSGNQARVEVTPNEYRDIEAESRDYRLCIVTNALDPGKIHIRVFRFDGDSWVGDRKGETLDIRPKTAARIEVI